MEEDVHGLGPWAEVAAHLQKLDPSSRNPCQNTSDAFPQREHQTLAAEIKGTRGPPATYNKFTRGRQSELRNPFPSCTRSLASRVWQCHLLPPAPAGRTHPARDRSSTLHERDGGDTNCRRAKGSWEARNLLGFTNCCSCCTPDLATVAQTQHELVNRDQPQQQADRHKYARTLLKATITRNTQLTLINRGRMN